MAKKRTRLACYVAKLGQIAQRCAAALKKGRHLMVRRLDHPPFNGAINLSQMPGTVGSQRSLNQKFRQGMSGFKRRFLSIVNHLYRFKT